MLPWSILQYFDLHLDTTRLSGLCFVYFELPLKTGFTVPSELQQCCDAFCVCVDGGWGWERGADKNLAASNAFSNLQPLFPTKHVMSNG